MAKGFGVSVGYLTGQNEINKNSVDRDIIEALQNYWDLFPFEDKTLVRVMVQSLVKRAIERQEEG